MKAPSRIASGGFVLSLFFQALAPCAEAPAGASKDRNPPEPLKVTLGISDTTEFIETRGGAREHKILLTPHVREYRSGQVAHVVIIATGFETSADGRYGLTGGYRVQKPDGSVLLERAAIAHAYGTVSKPKPGFGSARVMLTPALNISFDNSHAPGAYLIRATVYDRSTGASASVEDRVFLLGPLSPLMNPLDLPVDSAEMLDRLWGLYATTEDPRAVRRILSVLHLRKSQDGEEILLGAAAEWSLGSMAFQDPRVYAICKEELGKESGVTREMLSTLLQEVEKKKAASQSQPAAPAAPLPPGSPGWPPAPEK